MKKIMSRALTMLMTVTSTSFQLGNFIGGGNVDAVIDQETNIIIQKIDQNACKCDLNYEICDLHCCCDPTCAQTVLDSWIAANLCLPVVVIDPIDRFKCAGYDLYLNRMIKKNYTIESKKASLDNQNSLNYYLEGDRMRFDQGFVLKTSSSENCEKLQDIKFLLDESFNCAFEFNTGDCAIPPEIDPREISNNFVVLGGKTGLLVTISEIVFIQRDANRNYQRITALPDPANLVTVNGLECTYNAIVDNIQYFLINSNSDITAVKAIVELDSLIASKNILVKHAHGTKIKFLGGDVALNNLGQEFSGVGGYDLGKPVLIGTTASGSGLQRYYKDEIPFLGITPQGDCDNGNVVLTQGIRFGVNTTVSCLIPSTIFNSRQLTTATCTSLLTIINNLKISQTFTQSTLFGKFGNSNSSKIADWVEISKFVDFTQLQTSYNESERICLSPVSIQMVIFYSYSVSETVKLYYIQKIEQQPIFRRFSRGDQLTFNIDIKFIQRDPLLVRQKANSIWQFLNEVIVKEISPLFLITSSTTPKHGSIFAMSQFLICILLVLIFDFKVV